MITNLDPIIIYRLSFYNRIKWYNPFTWLGFLIRLIAGIPYNHTAVIYYNENKSLWYIQEANEEGVKSKYWFTANCIKIYDVCAIQSIKVVDARFSDEEDSQVKLSRIRRLEGRKYDYKGLLLYQLILNVFKKWIGKESQDDRYYCYEHVAEIFGFNNAYKVVPKEFDKLFNTIETINLN